METLQRTANRGSVSTGYDVDNSVVFETANSERLSRTNTNTGQRRTFSISAWIKRTKLGYNRTIGVGVSGNDQQIIIFNASDQLQWYDYHGGAYSFNYITNRVFRDTSSWYHFLFAVDTEQGTESNRVRLYINGVEETSFATQTEPSQNRDTNWNYANGSKEFGNILNEAPFASCYMSEVAFVDDAQLAPTDVGEFDEDTGIWKPIDISGLTFGTSGSYCEFKNASALGEDSSSNGNDFTAANITAADQATDTPTNNFATFNPLLTHGANDYFVVTNGSTHLDQTGAVGWGTSTATMAFNLGKWYAEFKLGSGVDTTMIGNSQIDDPQNYSASHLGVSANATSIGMGYYSANGSMYRNGGSTSYGDSYNTSGTIIGVALEFEANGTASMYVSKNGTWQNSADPAAGSGGFDLYYGNALPTGLHFTFAVSTYNNDGNIEANFGGFNGFTVSSGNTDANGYGNFEYAPPSGYYALCTKNLSEFG